MKFLITAAGSGGHIYPALSLANELKRRNKNAQITYLSSNKSIDRQIFNTTSDRVVGFDFISPQRKTGVNLIKFYLKNLYFLLNFSKESIRVFFLIKAIKPDIVIGFGGIHSVAAIITAKLLNIPSLIHEQNVAPGLANRMLCSLTSKVAIGFRKSNIYFKGRDVIFTGNPIRTELQRLDSTKARSILGLDINKFTILVVGGSQGAVFINDCFIKALNGLSVQRRSRLQVIHCCGIRDFVNTKKKYEDIEIMARIFAFCEDMNSAYNVADLIIGRAGAATLNEICFFGKASVLIPYPYAQAHQIANAEFMQEAQAAAIIKQDAMSASHLISLIDVIMEQPQVLESMAAKSRQLFCENSAQKLADVVIDIMRDENI